MQKVGELPCPCQEHKTTRKSTGVIGTHGRKPALWARGVPGARTLGVVECNVGGKLKFPNVARAVTHASASQEGVSEIIWHGVVTACY
jgi:hypothetical protein